METREGGQRNEGTRGWENEGMRVQEDEEERGQAITTTTTPITAPQTTAVSNCSWDGDRSKGMGPGEENEDGGKTRGKRRRGGTRAGGTTRARGGDDDDDGTHHRRPASRATACGVGRGWNDDDTHDSTLDHPHEPLLVGWKGGAREVWMCEMRPVGWQ